MRVTVFGGSQPLSGDPAYEQARRLGELLAKAGHTILNGGYIGTMEAVSRGAHEAGGHVIGVTCDAIEAWRPVNPNRWIGEEMRFATQRERLFALIENCDAAIALPGGIGTLAEVAEMWSSLQTGSIESRPLVLVGPEWRAVIEQFLASLGEYVPPEYRDLMILVDNVDQATKILNERQRER